jgi:hypothetical protein
MVTAVKYRKALLNSEVEKCITETVSNNASKNPKPEAITGQINTTGVKKQKWTQ